jgi:hypothetical protein
VNDFLEKGTDVIDLILNGIIAFSLAVIVLNLRDLQMGYVLNELSRRHGTAGYKALPSHEAMVFNPRYWHLWSVRQWEKWVGV